ncbi:hypothetical protein HK104_008997 [Borealophlyctis nickersoniae]|nr:hypothetical protein HK104_008997 [Borealophlyctis nickersoniae]
MSSATNSTNVRNTSDPAAQIHQIVHDMEVKAKAEVERLRDQLRRETKAKEEAERVLGAVLETNDKKNDEKIENLKRSLRKEFQEFNDAQQTFTSHLMRQCVAVLTEHLSITPASHAASPQPPPPSSHPTPSAALGPHATGSKGIPTPSRNNSNGTQRPASSPAIPQASPQTKPRISPKISNEPPIVVRDEDDGQAERSQRRQKPAAVAAGQKRELEADGSADNNSRAKKGG